MLTITEWAKTNPNPLQSGVVEIFAKENPVLAALPFQNVAGNAFTYNREQTLPGVAFRGFNESYDESTGVVQSLTETLRIIGGDSDYDVAQIAMQTGDNATRAVYDAMKSKALALTWLDRFFHGINTTNAKEFDGLNVRLTGNQVISAGTNGAQLTLDMLDDLIDAISGTPAHLLMNKAVRRGITKLARGSSNLSFDVDSFGRQITLYAGIPLAIVEDGADGNPILDFNETQGTSNVTSSVYAVNYAPDRLHGIQTAPVSVRDLGEVDDKPAYRTRIEWYAGYAIKHAKAAARLKGVLAPA